MPTEGFDFLMRRDGVKDVEVGGSGGNRVETGGKMGKSGELDVPESLTRTHK